MNFAFRFLIGDAIARSFGVPSGTAASDGLLAAIPKALPVGIVLVSAIARQQAASAASAPASQNTSPQLAAVPASTSEINLFWSPSSDQRVKAYTIWRGESSGNESFVDTAGLDLTYSDTDESLKKGTQYFYVVKAADGGTAAANVFAVSNEATATTDSVDTHTAALKAHAAAA